MAKFAIKYEIEVIVEAPIANLAWQKAQKVFNEFDYRGFDGVRHITKISTQELEAK